MIWNHKEWRHEITFVSNEKMHFKLSKEVTWGLIVRLFTWMIYGYQEIFRVRLTTFLNDSNYPNFDLVFRLVLSYNEVLNKNRLREKNSSFTIKFYHAVGKDSWVLFKLNNFLENILQATKVWLASVNYVMVTIGKKVLKNFRKFLWRAAY